jgi:pilus assembly protein Flp/PilA
MEKISQDVPDLIRSIASRAGRATLARFFRDESGATAIEYGLIAALIGVTAISTLKGAGSRLNARFTLISTGLN